MTIEQYKAVGDRLMEVAELYKSLIASRGDAIRRLHAVVESFDALLDSADSTGCSGDLTVVSLSAMQKTATSIMALGDVFTGAHPIPGEQNEDGAVRHP